jgi:hypothetical protein
MNIGRTDFSQLVDFLPTYRIQFGEDFFCVEMR